MTPATYNTEASTNKNTTRNRHTDTQTHTNVHHTHNHIHTGGVQSCKVSADAILRLVKRRVTRQTKSAHQDGGGGDSTLRQVAHAEICVRTPVHIEEVHAEDGNQVDLIWMSAIAINTKMESVRRISERRGEGTGALPSD